MASFENKTVIVTGCSSGIGLATILILLSRKANVFGIDIVPFTHSLHVTQSANFTFHQVNLCAPNAPEEAVAACIAKYGPKIYGLANVAGVSDDFGSADTIEDEVWDRVIAINLTAPVQLMRAVLPSMLKYQGGAIVNVGSKASVSGGAAGIAYTSSKHGLVGATKNVAWRFQKEGIRCNVVLPGGVPGTNISSSNQADKVDQVGIQQWQAVWSLNSGPVREGVETPTSPEDCAHGIVFLMSDHARSMNGVLLPVDNGWTAI